MRYCGQPWAWEARSALVIIALSQGQSHALGSRQVSGAFCGEDARRRAGGCAVCGVRWMGGRVGVVAVGQRMKSARHQPWTRWAWRLSLSLSLSLALPWPRHAHIHTLHLLSNTPAHQKPSHAPTPRLCTRTRLISPANLLSRKPVSSGRPAVRSRCFWTSTRASVVFLVLSTAGIHRIASRQSPVQLGELAAAAVSSPSTTRMRAPASLCKYG